MVEIRTWKTKEGKEGQSYHLQDGDSMIAMFDEPKEGEPRAGVTGEGKAFIAKDYFLGVKNEEHGEFTLKLTEGQFKRAMSAKPLKNKIITGENYKWKNPDTGVENQNVGLRVLEE